jgi:hypothetical protein
MVRIHFPPALSHRRTGPAASGLPRQRHAAAQRDMARLGFLISQIKEIGLDSARAVCQNAPPPPLADPLAEWRNGLIPVLGSGETASEVVPQKRPCPIKFTCCPPPVRHLSVRWFRVPPISSPPMTRLSLFRIPWRKGARKVSLPTPRAVLQGGRSRQKTSMRPQRARVAGSPIYSLR